jgi:hypothetical protein
MVAAGFFAVFPVGALGPAGLPAECELQGPQRDRLGPGPARQQVVGDRHAGGGRLSGQRCGAGAVDRGHIAAEILVRHPVGLAELISAPARRRRLPTLGRWCVP